MVLLALPSEITTPGQTKAIFCWAQKYTSFPVNPPAPFSEARQKPIVSIVRTLFKSNFSHHPHLIMAKLSIVIVIVAKVRTNLPEGKAYGEILLGTNDLGRKPFYSTLDPCWVSSGSSIKAYHSFQGCTSYRLPRALVCANHLLELQRAASEWIQMFTSILGCFWMNLACSDAVPNSSTWPTMYVVGSRLIVSGTSVFSASLLIN